MTDLERLERSRFYNARYRERLRSDPERHARYLASKKSLYRSIRDLPEFKAGRAAFRQKHKDRLLDYNRAYRKKHRAEVCAWSKHWRDTHPEKVRAARHRADTELISRRFALYSTLKAIRSSTISGRISTIINQTKTMKMTASFQIKINQFKAAFGNARKSLREAGQILVSMLDENPNTFEILMKQITDIRRDELEALEKIGRGVWDERIVVSASPAAVRALSVGLKIDQQRDLVEKPIMVLDRDGGVSRKRLPELTATEARRLITKNGLKRIEDQRKWWEEQKRKEDEPEVRYVINGDTITFNESCTFTWSEMMDLCRQIAPTATGLQSIMQQHQIQHPKMALAV